MHIALLLQKWQSFTPPDDTVKRETVRVVNEMTGIELERECIRVNRGQVFIDTDSVLKMELAMRRGAIETELRKVLGAKAPSSVR